MAKIPEAHQIVLPPARQKALRDLAPIIAEFERKIPALKRLGMATGELEEMLELTKAKRDILLQEFSS